ncbi:guanylate kinase [Desulfovibrio sp. OttesenSCG-928-O18]|nr:guanylate kinase [Desulfovibrio sp. OttesenSCG-928-O18]
MSRRPGIALVLCAPSGAGKTTLARRLMAEVPSFAFSVSCTTRPARPGEVHGKDYTFMSKEEFLTLREQGHFAEWAEVHGNFYGTPLKAALDILASGRDILFDIDVQGAAQLKNTLPQAFFAFILPPSKAVLEKRLRGRGSETEESVAKRMGNARAELLQASWFDAWIVNDAMEEAYADLVAAYRAAALSPARRPDLVANLLKEWE